MLVAIYRKILRRNKQGKAPRCDALLGALVRVVRLERTVSWSQTRRDTNFAIPGYSVFSMIPRRGGKSKIFLAVVIPVVKAAFMPFMAIGEKPAKRRRHKALRRFALPCPGYRHGTPKPGAIPASLYPDIQLLPLYHGEGRKAKLFLAAVIYVHNYILDK